MFDNPSEKKIFFFSLRKLNNCSNNQYKFFSKCHFTKMYLSPSSQNDFLDNDDDDGHSSGGDDGEVTMVSMVMMIKVAVVVM